MSDPITNADEYLRGQRDRQAGKPAEITACSDYQRGYELEYWREQNATWRSQQDERRRFV